MKGKLPRGAVRAARVIVILLGAVGVGLMILMTPSNLSDEPPRSPVSRARAEMRTLLTALESYYIDARAYPPSSPLAALVTNQKALGNMNGLHMTVLGEGGRFLTTPVAYLDRSFTDPFTPGRAWSYGYVLRGTRFLLISAGPDRDYDLDPDQVLDAAARDQDSATTLSLQMIKNASYDPTNGWNSSGDIVRQNFFPSY